MKYFENSESRSDMEPVAKCKGRLQVYIQVLNMSTLGYLAAVFVIV
jgi:hypothetical protein